MYSHCDPLYICDTNSDFIAVTRCSFINCKFPWRNHQKYKLCNYEILNSEKKISGCSSYFCFLSFSCIKFNRVSISLCRIVHSDTDRCSSRWGMIQELWLPKEEIEMQQHLTISIDTKPNRVLQTGGVWLHYDVIHTPSTIRLGWVNFQVRLLIRQTISSYYLETCKIRNIYFKECFT